MTVLTQVYNPLDSEVVKDTEYRTVSGALITEDIAFYPYGRSFYELTPNIIYHWPDSKSRPEIIGYADSCRNRYFKD